MNISIKGLAAVIALGCVAVVSNAQESGNKDDSDLYRFASIGSADVPDGVTFNLLVSTLVMMEKDNPDIVISLVMQEANVDQATAQDLLSEFRSSMTNIREKQVVAMNEIGCTSGVSRHYGDDTYTALEQMDDASEVVSGEELNRVLESVGEATAEKLQSWLDGDKLKTGHRKYDQRKLSESVGKSGYQRLDDVCRKLAADH